MGYGGRVLKDDTRNRFYYGYTHCQGEMALLFIIMSGITIIIVYNRGSAVSYGYSSSVYMYFEYVVQPAMRALQQILPSVPHHNVFASPLQQPTQLLVLL